MAVTAIPFKSPPPFELPPQILEGIQGSPFQQACENVLALMKDAGCADVLAMGLVTDGRLQAGPALAGTQPEAEALQATEREIGERALSLDSDAARQDFMGQAIAESKPLLMMGEVAEGEPSPFPPAFLRYLLAGQPRNNVGFLYVFPLLDAAGKAHGALALHRTLTAGPLNHDQPAITQALVLALGDRAAKG